MAGVHAKPMEADSACDPEKPQNTRNVGRKTLQLPSLEHLSYEERLIFKIFKPHVDAVLCSLLWVTLLGQGVGLGDPQRSLPAPAIL